MINLCYFRMWWCLCFTIFYPRLGEQDGALGRKHTPKSKLEGEKNRYYLGELTVCPPFPRTSLLLAAKAPLPTGHLTTSQNTSQALSSQVVAFLCVTTSIVIYPTTDSSSGHCLVTSPASSAHLSLIVSNLQIGLEQSAHRRRLIIELEKI
jgi:hypothetical protein